MVEIKTREWRLRKVSGDQDRWWRLRQVVEIKTGEWRLRQVSGDQDR